MSATELNGTVVPGDGWWAAYEQGEAVTTYDPVVCFVVRMRPRSVEVIGYTQDNVRAGRFKRADWWTNFAGYVRVDTVVPRDQR